MASERFLCLPLLILSLAAMAMVMAIPCQRPWSQRECDAIRVRCLTFTPRQCTDIRGTFIRRGGFCGYCGACVRFEGERKRCNTTEGNPGVGNLQLTSVCRSPLVCSARNNGICVKPSQCEYMRAV